MSGGRERPHAYVESTQGERGLRTCRRPVGSRWNIDGHLRTVWCDRLHGDPLHHPDRRYGWIDMPGLVYVWGDADALAILAGSR